MPHTHTHTQNLSHSLQRTIRTTAKGAKKEWIGETERRVILTAHRPITQHRPMTESAADVEKDIVYGGKKASGQDDRNYRRISVFEFVCFTDPFLPPIEILGSYKALGF